MDLQQLARKYIWWQSPGGESIKPHRIVAQVMDIGTFEDVRALRQLVGEDALARALREALPGEFSERSWHYWHLKLGISTLQQVPPLPVRHFE